MTSRKKISKKVTVNKKDHPESSSEATLEERQEIAVSELGSTGLRRTDGNVFEERLPELTTRRGQKVFREMSDNDPTVGAMLYAIQMWIRQVTWSVEAASTSPEHEKDAEFLSSALDDMSMTWGDTITEIISMLPFGWSYHEIVYKRRLGPKEDLAENRSKFSDGLIGWRKLPIRAQDTLEEWKFDPNGGIRGLIQLSQTEGESVFIPIEKALLFRTTQHKNNPEGRSILRNAYRPWWFKKNIENIRGIGVERDLAGLPIAYVPPRILDPKCGAEEKTQLRQIQDMVTNVRRDEQEGLVLPSLFDEKGNRLFDFKLLSTGGSRQHNTNDIIKEYDNAIATSVLMDFILLGHEAVGSFALAESKTAGAALAITSWLDSIAEIFNRFAIPRLFEMNGFDTEELPILTHGSLETVDLAKLGTFIQQITAAGAELFPNKNLEDYLKGQAGLPLSDSEEV